MTSKNTHPHGEQLSAYVDSGLDVARMRGIGEHLRGCAACRQAETDLRRTKSLVHNLTAPAQPGPEFWASAYRTLRVNDRERAAVKRPLWQVWRRPESAAHRRWAGGLAAAAVLVGALFAGPHTPAPPVVVAPAAPILVPAQDVSPDVSSLAELHTDSVSRLPLADPDRQKMIAADVQQPDSAAEAAGDADAAY